MIEATPSGGSPGGNAPAPSANPAPPPPEFDRGASGSFVRDRARQMAASMQPAPGEQPAADAQQQPQPQPSPPAEQTRVGENGYPQEINDAVARDAEAQICRRGLPQSPNGYQVTLPPDWQPPADLPPGTKFQFDMNSPELAGAQAVAHAEGMSQEGFSRLLGYFAANKIGEQRNLLTARQRNLDALGVTAAQRISAIETWIKARAGNADGQAVANFVKMYPSAPLVRTFEHLIRQFSSQGSVDYSPQHRETAEDPGKIPGYDQMNFTQRRVAQMTQMLSRPGYRGGGGRRGE